MEVLDRLVVVVGHAQRVRQVGVRLRRARVEIDRRAELRHRLVALALIHQRNPEIVVDVDRGRHRPQGGAEVLDRVRRLARVHQRVGEVVLRFRVFRPEAERLLVGRDRLGEPAFRAQRGREVVVGGREVRRERDGAVIVIDRLVEPAVLLERAAEIGLRHRPHQRRRQQGPVAEHGHGGDGSERPWAARDPPRAYELRKRDQAGRCEQDQQRHQRVAVPREHVEHDDACGIRQRHSIKHVQPRSHRPGDEDAEQRQRHENAEVADRSAKPQRQRPLRVRLLAFRVEHLGRIPQQRRLSAHQLQPGGRLRRHERERLVGPIARDFGGGERPAHRALGELGGVLALVLRRPAAEAQRLVGPVGGRVVADVEVGAELRRGDEEAAADVAVARRHRQQDDREAGHEQRGALETFAVRRSFAVQYQPRENHHDEDERVLACQRQPAHRQPQSHVQKEPRRPLRSPRNRVLCVFLCVLCVLPGSF